jgi:muramoyltetrapeptide carboxypeptidase
MIKPLPLQKGDWIGVAAPASPFDRAEFEKGVKTLEGLGFRVRFREDIFSSYRYLAGSDDRRLAELKEHFADPDVKAVVFARGGYGTLRILPELPLEILRDHPKIVLGYSDMTPLLTHLSQRLSWVVFHGPVVAKGMGDTFRERGKKTLLHCLTRPEPLGEIRTPELVFLKEGRAEAPLVGGCLSLIVATLKTPFELETDGKILFLEDVNEKPYAIDRMLTHLKLAGKFNRVKGVVFGPFQNSGGSTEELKQIVTDLLKDFSGPIAFGFPSGHMEDMMTIPMGVAVELDSQRTTVNFKEGALRG